MTDKKVGIWIDHRKAVIVKSDNERLGRSKVLSESIVGVESTDKLTDPQIVAKVKEHYGIAL
jgi:hypothetical protein